MRLLRPGYCPLARHNAGWLPACLVATTPWQDISTQWGWQTVTYVGVWGRGGNVSWRFQYFVSFTLDPVDVGNLSLEPIWNFVKGTWLPWFEHQFNLLKPNDIYICHTAALTSRRYILNIYSTNIHTEYFKHAASSPFFSSSKCRLFHNATLFGSCIIRILPTGCAKI